MLVIPLVFRAVIRLFPESIGNHFFVYPWKNTPYPGIINTYDGGAIFICNMADKFYKGLLDIFHGTIVIQMIIFDIGNYGKECGELKE